MKWFYQHILKPLWSRPARNIYFWLVMISLPLGNDVATHVYPDRVYYTGVAITISILIAYTYINNLWLMPKYMRHKRYGQYALAVVLLTLVASVVFIEAVHAYIAHYPKVKMHHYSVFSTPIGLQRSRDEWFYELYWCAGGLALWLFIMSTAWYMNDYARQQKQLEDVQRKQTEAELSFLKSQVNPHFLFNTLNNLYGLALKKTDTAPDAILRLSSILRYMLYESNSERVSFEKEKEVIQAYIDLELLRLPPSPDFKFSIQADREYHLPPLLWLPVLENVFKHATRVIADKYFINFSLAIENGVFTLKSVNNYKADSTDNTTPGGIGLVNLRKRLDLLYPGKYSIATDTTQDSYSITISIQL